MPSRSTTRRPEVRLATISLASRSDASARAFIARSPSRSLRTASSIAAAMNAVSAPAERAFCVDARAAAKILMTA
jgi:hypothetical protein